MHTFYASLSTPFPKETKKRGEREEKERRNGGVANERQTGIKLFYTKYPILLSNNVLPKFAIQNFCRNTLIQERFFSQFPPIIMLI